MAISFLYRVSTCFSFLYWENSGLPTGIGWCKDLETLSPLLTVEKWTSARNKTLSVCLVEADLLQEAHSFTCGSASLMLWEKGIYFVFHFKYQFDNLKVVLYVSDERELSCSITILKPCSPQTGEHFQGLQSPSDNPTTHYNLLIRSSKYSNLPSKAIQNAPTMKIDVCRG